jgi:hypothetical protein
MPKLFVTRRDGSERAVEADANHSVMEIIRDNVNCWRFAVEVVPAAPVMSSLIRNS